MRRIKRSTIRGLIKEELYRRRLLGENSKYQSVFDNSSAKKGLNKMKEKGKIDDDQYENFKSAWLSGWAKVVDKDGTKYDADKARTSAQEELVKAIKASKAAKKDSSDDRKSAGGNIDNTAVGSTKEAAIKVLAAKYEVINLSNDVAKGKFGRDSKRQMKKLAGFDESKLVALAKKVVADEDYVSRMRKAGFGSVIDAMM